MPGHLFGGRVRTSTALIALVFLVTLATYLLVRPDPGKEHKAASTPAPASTGPASAKPTARPRHRPTSTPTPSPTVTAVPSASETPRLRSAPPSAPVPSRSPAVPSETPSPSVSSSP